MKDRKLLTIGIVGVFCGLIAAILFLKLLKREPAPEPLPDFASYTNVKEKKEAFFSYILPFVEEENRDILAKRERIEKLHSRFSKEKKISRRNRKWLNKIGEEYDLAPVEKPTEEFLSQLLERVDVIPPPWLWRKRLTSRVGELRDSRKREEISSESGVTLQAVV